MRAILFILLIFSGCTPKALYKSGNDAREDRYLDFLANFESARDSVKGNLVIYYNTLDLVEERSKQAFTIKYRGTDIFKGSFSDHHYLTEVFDKSHLLITYIPGPAQEAGPDLYNRDSIAILNLRTGKLSAASLGNILLTRSSEFLFKFYNYGSDSVDHGDYDRMCAIDSIDESNNQILLIGVDRKMEIRKPLSAVPGMFEVVHHPVSDFDNESISRTSNSYSQSEGVPGLKMINWGYG